MLKSRGDVDQREVAVNTHVHGLMKFSVGDQVVLTKEDEGRGILSGMQGKLTQVSSGEFKISINEGADIQFNPKEYRHIQHDYAHLVHDVAGQSFDHVFVLHGASMDYSAFYQACSRHTLSCDYFSSGDKAQVLAQVEHVQDNILSCAHEEADGFLDDYLARICDVFYKDHSYYRDHDYTRTTPSPQFTRAWEREL